MESVGLFSTVPDDALKFGRGSAFDGKRVADWMELSKVEISRIASVSKQSVRYDANMPKPVRERLEEIASIANMVAAAFAGDQEKTALWFKLKNPLLGDISPRDMVRLGRYDRLRRFIINAMTDKPLGTAR